MKINLKQAVKYFFANPSLELVYMEAISNSMDAEASEIDIVIDIKEFSKPETLKLTITDNGVGFNDERFGKFSKLMEVEESSHKGIGKLVFLSYFESVEINSNYGLNNRNFKYSNDFDEKSTIKKIDHENNKTILKFTNYYLKKIATHEYLKPNSLKKKILEHFYPRLYLMKQEGKKLTISITLNVQEPDNRYEFFPNKQTISLDDIAELTVEPIESSIIDLFDNMEIHYSITEKNYEKTIITALCIDGRTHKMDIISDENIQ